MKDKKKKLTIFTEKEDIITIVKSNKEIKVPWFESYVAQTVKSIEEAFRFKAKRIILTGIKGDIQKGKFTLLEWPKMIQIIQEAIEHEKIKGASWETIEERRISIDFIDELIKRADGDTHIIICSCPEIFMEKVNKACGNNRNVHLTFARSGDINKLFSDKRLEKKKGKSKQKNKNKQKNKSKQKIKSKSKTKQKSKSKSKSKQKSKSKSKQKSKSGKK